MPTDDDLAELIAGREGGYPPAGRDAVRGRLDVARGPAFDRSFMQHYWGTRATFSPEHWFLNLMVELDGRPIGAQSVDAEGFAIHRTVHTGSWLGPRVPGSGLRQGDARRRAGLCLRRARRARRGDRGVPRQRGIERGVARARLRGERVRQACAGGCRPRHPEIPDDRRRLALTAAPRPRHRGSRRHAATCSGPRPPTEPRSRRPSRRPRRPTSRR